MLEGSTMQERLIMARILYAWEADKEKVLRDLGGIEGDHCNEVRIWQIERTIESLRQALQDDKMSD